MARVLASKKLFTRALTFDHLVLLFLKEGVIRQNNPHEPDCINTSTAQTTIKQSVISTLLSDRLITLAVGFFILHGFNNQMTT